MAKRHARLKKADTKIDELLNDIRVAYHVLTLTSHSGREICRMLQLHRNTLLNITDPDWSPSVTSIRRLERIIPMALNFNKQAAAAPATDQPNH